MARGTPQAFPPAAAHWYDAGVTVASIVVLALLTLLVVLDGGGDSPA